MISYRELVTSLRTLELERSTPVLAQAGMAADSALNGGVDTLLAALLASFDTLLAPAFTWRTALIPETGPGDNGLVYGAGRESNAAAEFFRPGLPADQAMGGLGASLRRLPQAQRSPHPILSFAGINAGSFLEAQSLADPLAPLRLLLEVSGWALLVGADQTANVSLHLAEQLAGRPGFTRWALTPYGVLECPAMPGCARGFNALAPRLRRVTRQAQAGELVIQAVPLADLVGIARSWIEADPLALLCDQPDCAMCQALRLHVARV